MFKDTESVQNTINRLLNDVRLNVDEPSIKLKRQYHKALHTLSDAKHEFDIFNDMKAQEIGE